ncbi:hypothetical protein WH47_02405 [Habropoda laboriosa]|uniref:Reverse transcriptase domain-containing protein n=1 Tax=Habropoda laboriosa TaxID=597456 RepID=A0A0L7QZ54_9HYME|nr:hypothetical protein WH47_02405 [Habropoda laboriosa]
MVTLDVKNAFNCLRWDFILGELIKREMHANIIDSVCDYLSERSVVYGQAEESVG